MKQVNYKIVYEINRKYLKLLMCTWFEISSITISRISIFKNVHDGSDKKSLPSCFYDQKRRWTMSIIVLFRFIKKTSHIFRIYLPFYKYFIPYSYLGFKIEA